MQLLSLEHKGMINGELISVRKHNYNCVLDDGVH